MKITDVRVFMHYSVWRNITFVRVDTDEGISGIWEATIRNKETAVKAAIENHLKPMLVGMSPFDIEKFFHTAFIRDAWRNGAVFNTAISGIEIAMWDIIGQKLGQPVYNSEESSGIASLYMRIHGSMVQRLPMILQRQQ